MNFSSLPMLLYGLILFLAFVSAMKNDLGNLNSKLVCVSKLVKERKFGEDGELFELTGIGRIVGYEKILNPDFYLRIRMCDALAEIMIDYMVRKKDHHELQIAIQNGTFRMQNVHKYFTKLLSEISPLCEDTAHIVVQYCGVYDVPKTLSTKRPIYEKVFGEVLHDVYQGIENWKEYNILIIQSAGDYSGKEEGVFSEKMEVNESGSYLAGAGMNAALIQTFLLNECDIFQSNIKSHNFSVATEEDPRTVIDNFLRSCKTKSLFPFIYYTGHGSRDGSWCFTLYGEDNETVRISPSDISRQLKDLRLSHMVVISQSCYSGKWLEQENIIGYTSATHDTCSVSTKRGSEFTLWVCGEGEFPKQSVPQTKGKNPYNFLKCLINYDDTLEYERMITN